MVTRKQFTFKMLQHVARALMAVVPTVVIVVLAMRGINAIARSAVEQRRLVASLRQRTEQIAYIREEAKIATTSSEAIVAAFPTSDNILDFVNTMETLARTHSLEQSLKFAGLIPMPNAVVGGLPLAVADFGGTVTGRRQDARAYLLRFQTLPYFAGIDGMSISGVGEKGWDDSVRLSFHGKLYIRNTTQ